MLAQNHFYTVYMCGVSAWFMQLRFLEFAASLKTVMFPGTNTRKTGQAALNSVPGKGRPDCQTQGHALIQAECDPFFVSSTEETQRHLQLASAPLGRS